MKSHLRAYNEVALLRKGREVLDDIELREVGLVEVKLSIRIACIVKIVDDNRLLPPGEKGGLLLTNLYNCTMPFIHLEIGDRGTLLPAATQDGCSCGSRRQRMKLLGDREDDYIFLPNGQRVSPRLVGTAVYRAAMDPLPDGSIGWLFRGFQVVQDAPDHRPVRIIPETGQSTDVEGAISRALRELHPAFRCTVVLVDDLPHETSGKFRKIICSIPKFLSQK